MAEKTQFNARQVYQRFPPELRAELPPNVVPLVRGFKRGPCERSAYQAPQKAPQMQKLPVPLEGQQQTNTPGMIYPVRSREDTRKAHLGEFIQHQGEKRLQEARHVQELAKTQMRALGMIFSDKPVSDGREFMQNPLDIVGRTIKFLFAHDKKWYTGRIVKYYEVGADKFYEIFCPYVQNHEQLLASYHVVEDLLAIK